MGGPESEPTVDDRVRLDGEFAAPELEAAYRRRHAPYDRLLGRVIVVTAAVAALSLGSLDAQLVSNKSLLTALWSARLGLFACSAVALYLVRGQPTPTAFTRVLGGWYCLTVALHVYTGSAWPAGHSELRMTAAMSVLMTYCVMPLPLKLQTAGALLFTGGALLLVCCLNPPDGSAAVLGDVCWLSVVNVLGIFLSYRFHVRQRLLFVAMLRQVEMSASLSRALAEVKTLRGLVRVCAWCRKVDAGGDWQQLEAYVRDHSHAEFTHGICPICMAAATREAMEGPDPK